MRVKNKTPIAKIRVIALFALWFFKITHSIKSAIEVVMNMKNATYDIP
jgi:hypothetical protein